MPQLNISQTVATGSVVNVITGWQYEYLPWPARIKLLIRAVLTLATLVVFSGSETIMEESPIQAGGTAGTTPAELTTPPVAFDAPGGDRLKFNVRNSNAASNTVDGIVWAFPL